MTRSYLGKATAFGKMCGPRPAQKHLDAVMPTLPKTRTGLSAAFLITTTRSVLPSGG